LSLIQRRLWPLAAALAVLATSVMGGGRAGGEQRSAPQRGAVRNPHGPVKLACDGCHTTTAWSPIRTAPEFGHDRDTRYPLRGMHQNADCSRCHINQVFAGVSTQCATCHADFHRRQMGADCERCHSLLGWKVSVEAVRGHSNRFPLEGAHALANCESCHKGAAAGAFTGLSTDCVSCHVQQYRQAQTVDHVSAGVPTTCQSCHGVDTWRDAKFDHNRFSRFQLVGRHAKLDCSSCHRPRQFKATPSDCFSCHATAFNSATPAHHVESGYPRDCTICHSMESWQGAKFDHASMTRYALTGAHASVLCGSCHAAGRFAGTSADCYGCHTARFEAASSPDHKGNRFPTNCEACHITQQWEGAKFEHSATRFALTGKHSSTGCVQCHVGNVLAGIPLDCASCHKDDLSATANPNHQAAGFTANCAACHSTAQWRGATYDHNTATKYPLTGRHTAVACLECHAGNRFASTPRDCAGCHQTNFSSAKNPVHLGAGFPTTCETCHTTAQWAGAKFDHNTATKFALTGKHSAVACVECHGNNRFAGIPQDCAACHQADFDAAKNPLHRAAGFSTACQSCHTTGQWQGAPYDHGKTRYPLTGRHTSVTCQQCHAGGQYAGLPSQCSSCHADDAGRTTNPNHKLAGFSTACETCHTTARWQGAVYDHGKTRYPLTGKHASATCQQCHAGGQYAGLPSQCATCHQQDADRTVDPNHKQAGFPPACETCHTTAQWKGVRFDHNTATRYQLTGAHIKATCQGCHANNQYRGTAQDCVSCHLGEYNATKSPAHKAAGFTTACGSCHTTLQWPGSKYDHDKTRFALTGMHTAVSCQKCHASSQYAGLPSQCVACHLSEFNRTTTPDHRAAGYPEACGVCHGTLLWYGARFDHGNTTKFALTGRHVTVQCQQCHSNGRFAGTPQDCGSCHANAYNLTRNPPHRSAGFAVTCNLCHTTAQWTGAKIDHAKFALTGKHTTVACQQCHTGTVYAGLPTDCASCHLTVYNNTRNPAHKAAGYPTTCTQCHTTAQWTRASFNHTKFALTGKHTTVSCQQCHTAGVYAGLPTDCASCHLTAYNNTRNPAHKAAGYPTTCTQCHTTAQWTGASFNHTKFALTGKHTTVGCQQCHTGAVYAGLPSQCSACHLADYNGTKNPNHKAAGFSTSCETCHTTTQWPGAKIDHSKFQFALTGKHTTVACQQCHTGGVYAGLPTDCASCHLTAYNNTRSPAHKAAGFPTTCNVCHTTAQWTGASFNHTKFALTGKHTTVSCQQCHTGTVYAGLPSQCASCHITNYNGTTNPNHKAAGFSTSCETCHTTTQWPGAKIDHSKFQFALTGKHTTVGCQQCHSSGQYATLSVLCSSCHLASYNGTTNPNHKAAGFPTTCNVCHTTTQWTGASFNHTKFALTGKHTTVGCQQCHTAGVYAGLPSQCVSCHLANYNGTANPNHKAAGFPTTCNTCHTTTQWPGAIFDHGKTLFPLSGRHTTLTCQQCHASGQYAGLSRLCASCHLPKYNATTNPKHSTAGFPTDCSLCHTTSGWPGAIFNHSATKFALTGAHTTLTCAQCHASGTYAGLGSACADCHLPRYNATTSPNHRTANYPTTCNLCHSTTQWKGATFNHSSTRFPLTGAHSTKATCANCHVNGVYAGTPTLCFSCHQTVYNTVTNPNHIAAGFAKTCESCHTTAQWTGARYANHTRFPIYSGSHSGKWSRCNDCHTNPSSYAVFTCTGCHQHAQATVDPKHKSVRGYVYNSTNCYSCHPAGRVN